MPDEDELTPSTDQSRESRQSREELECAKLRAEAAKLDAEAELARRPFYKSAGFYSAMVPIVLALASLPFSIKLFQADWKLLEYDTRKLTEERISSSNAVTSAKAELARVEAKYRGAEAALTNELRASQQVLALLRRELTNTVNLADTTTNRVALTLLEELRRVQEQRDTIFQAYLALQKYSNGTEGWWQMDEPAWKATTTFREHRGLSTWEYEHSQDPKIARVYARDYLTMLERQIRAAEKNGAISSGSDTNAALK